MDNSLTNLLRVETRSRELLKQHGLWNLGWRLEISSTKSMVGRCRYDDKVIEISRYFLGSEWSEIEDTLLHEIAHALVGPDHDHDWIWKLKCQEVGANPTRVTEKAVNSAKPNYVLKCPTCGRRWERFRLKRFIREGHALCPDDRTNLKVFRVIK